VKLIVGLGNPGEIYQDSRHNIGFKVVEAFAKKHKITLKKDEATFSLCGKARIASQGFALALPLTFMNLSGVAVRSLLERFKADLSDLLVVLDDLDLEFGRLKIRSAGSSGGHRGLRSIIDALGNANFCRLRVGIGRPPQSAEATRYVLSSFSKREKPEVELVVGRAIECCQVWLTRGINASMNIFNKKTNAGPSVKRKGSAGVRK
jgi:PTH1 family peptidyl-tRNA hydrolase